MAAPATTNRMQSVPNILTVCRIFAVPVLVVLLSFPTPLNRALAAFLFIVASVTDYFDGYLARRYNVISSVGKLLDPMADKLLVMAALIMIVACAEGSVPAWMVVIILGREIMITSLRGVASAQGVVIEAEELGKYKTILQIYAITGLCMHHTYFHIDFHFGGMYLLWASLILSVWSGIDYLRKFWHAAVRQG